MNDRSKTPDFSASHVRLEECVQEVRSLCLRFEESLREGPAWEAASAAAWDFCVVSQKLHLRILNTPTAYDDVYKQAIAILEEFASNAASFVSRPDVKAAGPQNEMQIISNAARQCIMRCEALQRFLERKEVLQSMLWGIAPQSPTGRSPPTDGAAATQETHPASFGFPEDTADDDLILGERIDSGYFGVVWKATQKSLRRIVAVKIIRPSMELRSSAVEHAQALARLNHENIVTVHTVSKVIDPDTGTLVHGVVMEWIEGKTLGDILLERRFSAKESLRICRSLFDAIEAMHANGLTHGDLHCGNVVIADKRVKVIDLKYADSQSLAMLTAQSRQVRIQQDIDCLRRLGMQILSHSDVDLRQLNAYEPRLREAQGLRALRALVESLCGSVASPVETGSGTKLGGVAARP